jgi:hypothetical protein
MKIKISSSPLFGFVTWENFTKKSLSEFCHFILSKNCFLLLFVIFQFAPSESLAQNFFPLKVGNTYQVEDDWWWIGPGGIGESGTDYYSLSVAKDTVIDSDTFYTLSCNFGNFSFNREYYFRYDSVSQKLLVKLPNDTLTKLAVDFNTPADSQYISYIRGEAEEYISKGLSYQIVLGDTHLVYTMEDVDLPMHLYQFSDNLGFTNFKYYNGYTYGASSSDHFVISAIIDSVIINPLILSVDTLYPIFDRPADTFPYLLTIPYTASYSVLIDSFFLDVEHFRSDTLIQTKKYNLSKSNPSHVSLYLSGLLNGDKINLRATITDTSIFFNKAHYPDTGWVVMNVLPPILNVENENLTFDYELVQNYPNPFNPTTRIRYQIPKPSFVTIKVFDVLGNEIKTLIKEEKIAGSYEIEFDGSALTSGIYYYRITSAEFLQTKKMILLK